jgi:2-alkyl-3-oxoalkanoate reductase
MRVFVIGASGAIGTRLVSQLIDRGHDVIGTTTSPGNEDRLRVLGAEPIVLDLLDPRAVRKAVLEAAPDAIVNEATALADVQFSKNLDRSFVQTNRIRTEGTDAVLAAARDAGVSRIVAQSFASLRYVREGGPVKTEDDPLDAVPIEGIRANNRLIEPVHKRQFPIVGDGGGVSSFIHLDDAAAATVLALEQDGPAIYNIVDDEPAPVRVWLPVLAEALRAKPPRNFPVWLARMFAGEPGVVMGTEARGASNEKAKRELGWTLRYPSWRQGFAEVYAKPASSRPGHSSALAA